ncbi:GDP-mannose 4,6-dehydratase [Muricauda oceani]|uniref:NAD-dependent epimerase/dehydratase family protein n=1 Tax=Flagellimonas oceani TaxID=2698672 RepID=A0A6G7J6E7_9FLAO|nr:GDP-mannose 4,6-dehydratase [Allomuricauda oceani]MBW8242650.1 GDP-mannose 4,6-dehydratase [Allomuricauda oceani]QII46405.1 NAD-dependent epimerase/dehydratase family protein [Allomuricauda oceani]
MENPIDKTVLITGITGFTGAHLESFFSEKGYNVHGTTNSKPLKNNHTQCDILEYDEMAKVLKKVKPELVVHLAAISFAATKDIPKIYDTNVRGTINLLDALVENVPQVEKVLIASSAAVYGNIGTQLSEEMCPRPINHYGNSKLAMENMATNYFDKLDIIITRPFNYTGKGQENHFLVPKIVKHFKEKKKEIELGNLNTFREYNDIRLLQESYEKLLFSSFRSGIVNIASGRTYSINEILEIMAELTGYHIKVGVNPEFVRKNEIHELKGSPKKLQGIIGKLDSVFLLKDTLKEMYSG